MSKAVRLTRHGGPEVLELVDCDPGQPGPGEVLLRQHAAGVNMIDLYHRTLATGQYAVPLPAILGVDGAGVVEAVGEGVTTVVPGDRVAYLMALGGYTERRVIPAQKLFRLPDTISFATAAAVMVKGATAQYLLHRVWQTRPGDTILLHAAAGGVGSLLCDWATRLGARVTATVGSDAKMQIARDAGAAEVLNYRSSDFASSVRDITGGRGVDVVFDSIGADTFQASLRCLRPLGLMVSYGQASGPVADFDISDLARNGSIFLAKPTLATFTNDPALLQEMVTGLFHAVETGMVKPNVSQVISLKQVAQAHRDMDDRKTVGSIVINL